MDDKKLFGERLRAVRQQSGWTLRAFAKELGLQPSAISQFEHGVIWPFLPTFLAMVRILDCSADYLLGRTSNPQQGETGTPKK